MSNSDNSLAKTREMDGSLRGVRGWLLFLCVMWTILIPFVLLIETGYSLRDLPIILFNAELFPGLAAALIIDLFLSLGIVAFSITAGVRLWRIKPGAVRTARIFLYSFFAYSTVSSILIYLAIPPEIRNVTSFDITKEFIQSAVYSIIWLLYLRRSKRVASTYGALS